MLRTHGSGETVRILDMGAGTGNHAFELQTRGYEVLGIDVAPEMVNRATERAVGLERPPTFRHGDMRDLPIKGPFDLLISMFGAFGYVPRAEVPATLAGFREVLRPGGLLLIEFWNVDGAQDGHKVWDVRETGDRRLIRLGRAAVETPQNEIELTFRYVILRGHTLDDEFVETHHLTLFQEAEMRDFLEAAGFTPLAMFDWDQKTLDPARPDNYRILAVARREATAEGS